MIKDADPDDGPVPKDGCQMTWLGWYLQVMRDKKESGERTPNEFNNKLLLNRYPDDNTVNNKKTSTWWRNCDKEEAETSGYTNLVFQVILYVRSFIEVRRPFVPVVNNNDISIQVTAAKNKAQGDKCSGTHNMEFLAE